MNRKRIKVVFCSVLMIAILLNSITMTYAAQRSTLSFKKVILKVGKNKKVKVLKMNKKAKYTFKSSNKKILKVSKTGNMTAVRKGNTTVTVWEKIGKKTRTVGTVKVTVISKTAPIQPLATLLSPTLSPTQLPTQPPTKEPTPLPTQEPMPVPTNGPTILPEASPSPQPTGTPNVYTKEILTLNISVTGTDEVNGTAGEVDMIHFNGEASGDYFTGKVISEGVDTQKEWDGEARTMSARYMLEGKDSEGQSCRIFIENNGADASGDNIITPSIITNSKTLSWMETADLQGVISTENGGLVIHIMTTESNQPSAAPTTPPVLQPTSVPKVYSKEILTLNISITGTDEVKGPTGVISMIHFGGTAKGDNFTGKVIPGGVDTQKNIYGQTKTLSARYILTGVDRDGQSCQIFIENNGTEKNGVILTTPRIITDSKALSWMETADMQGVVSWENGGLVIHVRTTE